MGNSCQKQATVPPNDLSFWRRAWREVAKIMVCIERSYTLADHSINRLLINRPKMILRHKLRYPSHVKSRHVVYDILACCYVKIVKFCDVSDFLLALYFVNSWYGVTLENHHH